MPRVCGQASGFVVGFDPATESNHLRNLKPSPMLVVWHQGYDKDGRWQPQQVAHAAEARMAERKKRAAQQKRQDVWAERRTDKRAASNADKEMLAAKRSATHPLVGE